MVGLFWAAEFLNRQEGRQEGVAIVLDMSMMKIAGLKVIMEKVMSGKEVTVKELMDQLEKNKNDK
jgi:FixJ family two-component response regulator